MRPPKQARRLPRPIPTDHLYGALAAAAPGSRVRPMIVLAAWCGLRAKEIALLRRERVTETAAVPGILVAADATKGRNERYVPMSDFVLAELAPVLPAQGWVFRRGDGNRGPNTPGLVSFLVNRHLHSCGYAETCHQLRHWFGTEAYAVDHDLRLVQELMGHGSPASTAGYAKVVSAAAAATVQALPAPGLLRAAPGVPA